MSRKPFDPSNGGAPGSDLVPESAFRTWLEAGSESVWNIAIALECSPDMVYKMRRGTKPGAELRLRIERLSDGQVAFESW